MFCKFPANHDCCRCLDHDSCHDLFKWNVFFAQSFFYFLNDLPYLIHFFFRIDHREHHCEITIRTGTINCTKLCFKHSSSVKTETNPTVAHDRIGFLRNVQVRSLLVCSEIRSTDHRKSLTHCLCYFFICTEKFIFSRIIFSSKILELTSQKPNSLGAIKKDTAQITHISNIGIKTNIAAILCFIFLCLQFQKFLSLSSIRFQTNLIFFLDFRIRVKIKSSCITIYDCCLSIPLIISCNIDQSWNFHCFRHN